MSKRPGLGSLPFATKPGTKPPEDAASEPVSVAVVTYVGDEVDESGPAKSSGRRRGPKPKGKVDDRVTIILRVSAEERKQLKAISVERDTTIQDMLHKSVTDTIRRNQKS